MHLSKPFEKFHTTHSTRELTTKYRLGTLRQNYSLSPVFCILKLGSPHPARRLGDALSQIACSSLLPQHYAISGVAKVIKFLEHLLSNSIYTFGPKPILNMKDLEQLVLKLAS